MKPHVWNVWIYSDFLRRYLAWLRTDGRLLVNVVIFSGQLFWLPLIPLPLRHFS